MNTLESPLEALAFNYLTYGFITAVNNIWAWVAVVTAAVSFWRIRFSSTAELVDQTSTAEEEEEVPPTVTFSSFRVLERQGSTKMKFSLYYEAAGEGDESGEEREDDGGEGAAVGEKWWCDDWEKMMVMRMGDMGWYKWQDTTSLDGSVVRLWDGRREAAAEVAVAVVGDVVLRRLY